MVQWLRLSTLIAKGPGLIPDQGTKFPQAMWNDQKHTHTHTQNTKHTILKIHHKVSIQRKK